MGARVLSQLYTAPFAAEEFAPLESDRSYPALWATWLANGFKSFRITDEQLKLVDAGRCRKEHVRARDAAAEGGAERRARSPARAKKRD